MFQGRAAWLSVADPSVCPFVTVSRSCVHAVSPSPVPSRLSVLLLSVAMFNFISQLSPRVGRGATAGRAAAGPGWRALRCQGRGLGRRVGGPKAPAEAAG